MFLGRLLERRGRPMSVVSTSNTLPSDLGRGRFAAEAFQREIGELADRFEVLTIDGEDYRHRRWDELAQATSDAEHDVDLRRAFAADPAPDGTRVLLDWPRLASELEAVHPVHYAQIATQLEAMRERTPRGGTRWHPSSVEHLLARAEQLGLAGAPPALVDPRVWR